MAAILVALLVGGLAAGAMLWPYGWLYVALGVPLGASGLAMLVAVWRFWRRTRQRPASPERLPPRAAGARSDP